MKYKVDCDKLKMDIVSLRATNQIKIVKEVYIVETTWKC